MKPQINPNKLEVYTESRKRRIYVGELTYSPEKEQFRFKYDPKYKSSPSAIPVGPELDLFQKEHISKGRKLFPSFGDRIPSKSNPAYEEYCRSMGISPTEKNQIILLTTIGRKGPSTFVFEPVAQEEFSNFEVLRFRKELRLSRYDFAQAFGLNELTVQRIEKNQNKDSAVFRFVEVLLTFPEVALWQLERTGKKVSTDVSNRMKTYFEKHADPKKQIGKDKTPSAERRGD